MRGKRDWGAVETADLVVMTSGGLEESNGGFTAAAATGEVNGIRDGGSLMDGSAIFGWDVIGAGSGASASSSALG